MIRQQPDADPAEIRGWLTGRLPQWFDGAPEVVVDRDEITIIGTLPTENIATDDTERAAARRGAAKRFREDTRDHRVTIARELEARYNRAVAWGVEVDAERFLFTHHAAPVMTRLRQPERQVLDTLVAGGVARSRADALAWCVKLVNQHTSDWLAELDDALTAVDRVRAEGPSA
jgi:hypothetical protein